MKRLDAGVATVKKKLVRLFAASLGIDNACTAYKAAETAAALPISFEFRAAPDFGGANSS